MLNNSINIIFLLCISNIYETIRNVFYLKKYLCVYTQKVTAH